MSFLTGGVMQRGHDLARPLAQVPRALRLIWQATPRLTSAWAVILVVQGLLPAAIVYFTRLVVDGLVAAIAAHGAAPQVGRVAFWAALIVIAMLWNEGFQIALEYVRTAQAEYVQDYIKELIHRQSIAIDMAYYETAEFYDRLERARSEASSRSLTLIESSGSLMQSGITLVAMAAILLPYGPWLPLALVAGTLPALYSVLRFDRRYHRWWQRTTADRRWAQYYDVMLTHNETAAEVRLFQLGAHFRSAYQALQRRLRGERLALLRRQAVVQFGAAALALAVVGAALLSMAGRALGGQISLGELAFFYQAFTRGQSLLRALLGSAGQLYTSSLYLENLFAFLDLPSQIVDPAQPQPLPPLLRKHIVFRNVSFRYPNSARSSLENFSLTIPAGKVAAIVGENGVGKTTLLKLLCRFYDPEQGSIEIDGVDLRDFAIADLRRFITVLFQSPVPYHATVANNIALGDLEASDDKAAIEQAAYAASAAGMIGRLPHGYDTLLGTWFADGTDLSGGEWQRIAMARALLRRAPVMILDEPTSALDPWAEGEWFDRFKAQLGSRTAIAITHRFTIAMRADIIFVMHEGRVVEQGSHDELLAGDGLYAQSWAAQLNDGWTL